MEVTELILVVGVAGGAVFPAAYAWLRSVPNQVLFLFASYGAGWVVPFLLLGVAAPLVPFMLFIHPQLAETGIELRFLARIADIVWEYGWILTPAFLCIAPPLLHRRYIEVFAAIRKE